jgi:hypothetical protein
MRISRLVKTRSWERDGKRYRALGVLQFHSPIDSAVDRQLPFRRRDVPKGS